MNAFIECRGVTRAYRKGDLEIKPVDGLDLDVEDNSFTALMGPSGSGKSTLLNLIGGLDRPSEGQIEVGGQRIDAVQ